LHQIAHVGVIVSRDLKLSGREIIFEELPKLCEKRTSTSQTDGQSDDMQSYKRALRSIAR